LAKKRDPNQANTSGKNPEIAGLAVPANLKEQSGFDNSIRAAQTAGTTTVEVPPELQQLVREISVVVNAPEHQQIHIELNSSVLKGLQIRIERQQGAIAIQFQSASAAVTRLVSTNLNTLAQGLAERGVNVSDIRVNRSEEASSAPKYKQGTDPSRRWQGGRQRQRG
jgi:flagellar hook-length control protein FliK